MQTDPGASLQAWIDGVHKRHARLSLRRGAKGQWAVRINLDGHMPVGRLHLTIQARLGSVATRRVTDLQVVAKKHHLAPRVAAFVGLAHHLASLVKPCNQAMSAVQSALHARRPAAMRMAATRARRLVATCRTAWNRAKALPIAAVLRPYDSVHRLIDMIATAAHHASHTAGTIAGGAPVPKTHDTRLRSQLANAVRVWRSDMARARSLALTISHHWHVSTRSVPAFT